MQAAAGAGLVGVLPQPLSAEAVFSSYFMLRCPAHRHQEYAARRAKLCDGTSVTPTFVSSAKLLAELTIVDLGSADPIVGWFGTCTMRV